MRRLAIPAGLFVFAVLAGCALRAAPAPKSDSGRRVADFTLKDAATDKPISLGDFKTKKAIVVVFIGTECPINNAYMPVLAELAKTYADKNVQFLAVNSNSNDAPAQIAGHAQKNHLPFPVLRDAANGVADQFGAKRTPEAFVLDPDGHIMYQGRIDDQFGVGAKRAAPAVTSAA
jgi:peroxiredoxin